MNISSGKGVVIEGCLLGIYAGCGNGRCAMGIDIDGVSGRTALGKAQRHLLYSEVHQC